MAGKYHTIIFVPHARAKFRKLTVGSRLLWSAAGAAGFIVASAFTFSTLYLLSARKDRIYQSTLQENERLKHSAEKMTARLSQLSRELDGFEDRTRKLAIVAGMPSLSDAGRGGLGGPVPEFDAARVDLTDRGSMIEARLSTLEKKFAKQNAVLASTPSIEPVRGVITCGFGERSDPFSGEPAFHTGLDISSQRGHSVVASADGTVVKAGWLNGYGQCIEISHGMGVRTLYGHLDEIHVLEGQHVARGEDIGVVGSTGRATAPHLHYEIRLDNRPINPLEYIVDLHS